MSYATGEVDDSEESSTEAWTFFYQSIKILGYYRKLFLFSAILVQNEFNKKIMLWFHFLIVTSRRILPF